MHRTSLHSNSERSITRFLTVLAGFIAFLILLGFQLTFSCLVKAFAQSPLAPAPTASQNDEACAACHKEIYDRYQLTPMARASGSAVQGLLPGEFTHALSGIRYRLYLENGRAWLSYNRLNPKPGAALDGRQELLYFVGSGKRGRTYLFEQQGFWFESPVNWYAKEQLWDMAPNYRQVHEMPFTLPVTTDCLHCHASTLNTSLPGSRNHFVAAPFQRSGISCASCHGDPSRHLMSAGKEPILNPANLAPAQRDSICLECHLEGEIAIARKGYSTASYHPGDNLFQQVVYFIHPQQNTNRGRASSQWEALLESACKRNSGDRLTCTTCHDAHGSPSPETEVSFYRGKCIACHSQPAFVSKHHPEQPDCASCHMPRKQASDVAHEQITDHRIQILGKVQLALGTPDASARLVTVGGAAADDRELGLAYAQLASHNDLNALATAQRLLSKAEQADQQDPEVHTQLGFVDQLRGDLVGAQREYTLAMVSEPNDSIAAGNLAVLEAREGSIAAANTLWKRVLNDDPSQTAAGVNLAIVSCSIGDTATARQALERVLLFSPDQQSAHAFLQQVNQRGCPLPKSK